MKVNDPLLITNPVKADSPEVSKGFSYVDPEDGETMYFLPLSENPNLDIVFTDPARKGTEPDYVLVLNIKSDCIGVVPVDQIVEPVEFIVNVETVE